MATGTNKESLNLRSSPSTSARILRVIQPNSQFTIMETQPDWLKVQIADGSIGYVAAQYVTVDQGQVAQPAPATTATTATVPAPAQPAPTPPVVQNPVAPAAAPAPAPVTTPAPVTAPVVTTTATMSKLLIVATDAINVRSAPVIDSAVNNKIDVVTQGMLLTPLESDADVAAKVGTPAEKWQWIKVRTPSGKEGYVAAWLVAFAPAATVTVSQQAGTTNVQVTTTGNPPPQINITIGASSINGPLLQPELHSYINTIPNNYPIPQGYYAFWSQRGKLGLPDPFDISPTQLDSIKASRMPVNGFGPNSFSVANWQAYYKNVCGMHNGLDHIVQRGTPLVALTDGVIVGTQSSWPFMGNPNDKDVILWCFLPEQYKDAQGRRMLSNVLIAYAHMSDNTRVSRHQIVKAGDVIGISGNPAGETGNDHLHLEVHLLTGDNALPRPGTRKLLSDYKRPQPFDNRTPFNPLLFFSERLVKYHLHQGKKIGFGSGPTYPDPSRLSQMGLNWPALDFFTLGNFQYGTAPIWTFNSTPWPNGIYDLNTLNARIANYTEFVPYPSDFL